MLTHNSRKGKSKSSSKQPTVKKSERQQSFFAGKTYLKIDSLVKTPLHEFMAVARSGLWAPDNELYYEAIDNCRQFLPLRTDILQKTVVPLLEVPQVFTALEDELRASRLRQLPCGDDASSSHFIFFFPCFF